MNYIYKNGELYHHGVKGMKWGVRRKRNNTTEVHEDYKRAHTKKSVQEMSDRELNDRINRLQKEKTYSDLTSKTNKGVTAVKKIIAVAGTITAAEGAYKVYAKYGKAIIDKIGKLKT